LSVEGAENVEGSSNGRRRCILRRLRYVNRGNFWGVIYRPISLQQPEQTDKIDGDFGRCSVSFFS